MVAPPKMTSCSCPWTSISIGDASEVRKSPLFQTTPPSLWRNAITAWPGPPTLQMIVSR